MHELEILYANRIAAAWSQSIDGIIEVGRVLIEAKAALPHGGFEIMVRDRCPFGARSARCLMAIANHEVISNRNHGSELPVSWRTLYELAKFEPAELEYAIANHMIRADLKRDDVPQLRRQVIRGLGGGDVKPRRSAQKPLSFNQQLKSSMSTDVLSWLATLDQRAAAVVAERVAALIETLREEVTDGKQEN